ncbi:MAG: DUF368 domain-containing protein [Deltaproteobacteria bacterium]|nr:DUF368 domain-containing protein [Deltaproteobacteria bacterium]
MLNAPADEKPKNADLDDVKDAKNLPPQSDGSSGNLAEGHEHSVLSLVWRGAAIGVAEAIPGVSGGTVALILGVYARLINAIRSYKPSTLITLLKALPAVNKKGDERAPFDEAARAVYLPFLIPLAVGMLPAVLVGTKILPSLMEAHRMYMHALFFGMILASCYVPFSLLGTKKPAHFAGMGLGAVGAYVLVGFSLAVTTSLPFIFLCGAIAICAMILPGVSGSYLLTALGQYSYISHALHERDVVTIGVFLTGMALGITLFVRLLSRLIRNHGAATFSVLTGLMIGSLRSVWPYKVGTGEFVEKKGKQIELLKNEIPDVMGSPEWMAIGFVVLGMAIVVGLLVVDKKLSKKENA